MADQIGEELTALPYIGNDPTTWIEPENDNELTPWGAVKALLSGGESNVVAELKELISRILPVGRQEFSPFRADSLPTGWYAMNGQTFLDTSPQGVALLGLPQSYRDDWGIVHGTDYMVNVPNFFGSNGKGYFFRAVDGTVRQVGSVQTDASRPIDFEGATSGSISGMVGRNSATASGAFSITRTFSHGDPNNVNNSISDFNVDFSFDSSKITQENTDDENRPINIGMTPAIYLGV